MKTVSFKAHKPATAEEWVSRGDKPPAERTQRLSIDLTPDLHTRIKIECARRRLKMGDVIRELLEQHFPKS